MAQTCQSFPGAALIQITEQLCPIQQCLHDLGKTYDSSITPEESRNVFKQWLICKHPDKNPDATEESRKITDLYTNIFLDNAKGKNARAIMNFVEKWINTTNFHQLLTIQAIQEAINIVDTFIDDIDDHNDAANPQKDIVTVTSHRYAEAFPERAQVYVHSIGKTELVQNPLFEQLPRLLQMASTRHPLIITSVRQSSSSDTQTYGKQYLVDSADDTAVNIHYEHEGGGNIPIPTVVIDTLFILRGTHLKAIRYCKAECISCASEESKRYAEDHEIELQALKDHLYSCGMKKVSVPPDGHCILHSWRIGLASVGQIMTNEELLHQARTEIANNLQFYREFLPEDLESQLDEYTDLANYHHAVVDLMVFALATATATSCTILSIRDGKVRTTNIEPRGQSASQSIFLCKFGAHYDAVVDTDTPDIHAAEATEWCTVPGVPKASSESSSFNLTTQNRFLAFHDMDDTDECNTTEHTPNVIVLSSTSDTDDHKHHESINLSNLSEPVSIVSSDPDENSPASYSKPYYQESVDTIQKSNTNPETTLPSAGGSGPFPQSKLNNQIPIILTAQVSSDSDESSPNPYSRSSTSENYSSPISVTALPFDINGDKTYKLPYNPEKRMQSSKDGRPWKTWVTSSRKGLAGIRRVAHCKGSYKCCSSQCPYRKQYGCANRAQFEREEGDTICKCCGLRALHVNCPAVKVWEFPKNSSLVTVIHTGKHTCVAIPKPNTSKVEETFKDNPNLCPGQAARYSVVNALKSNRSWKEVVDITDSFIDTNKVKNTKAKVRQEMHPSGFNFEAVGHLKSKMEERDPFYIYRVNDRKLNDHPSYVFKSSRVQANIALSMDRSCSGVLSREYCFMDVKHSRCIGFKTFSAHVYHPILRRIVTLATFWQLLNQVLQEVSGDKSKFFNPFGWMADEAGANWSALSRVFGQDVLSRTVGCQFHFKESVNRHALQLNSTKSKAKLKQLAHSLMEAVTPAMYRKCIMQIKDFISEKPDKRNYLTSWLDWWHARRFHVFMAFRATDNSPTTNLAESIHSSWKTTQTTNLTLVDAAYHDIAEAIKIERQIQHYKCGSFRGGSGSSAYARQDDNHHQQMRRAEQYAADITSQTADERMNAQASYPDDPTCSHRPTKRKQKLGSKPKGTKKPRVSSHLRDSEIEALTSSSSASETEHNPTSANRHQKSRRTARYRAQRSKTFEASLHKAKSGKNTFQVTQILNLTDSEKVFSITRKAYSHETLPPTYHVKISTDPSCSCPYSRKSVTICKHRIWVMLYALNVAEDLSPTPKGFYEFRATRPTKSKRPSIYSSKSHFKQAHTTSIHNPKYQFSNLHITTKSTPETSSE